MRVAFLNVVMVREGVTLWQEMVGQPSWGVRPVLFMTWKGERRAWFSQGRGCFVLLELCLEHR